MANCIYCTFLEMPEVDAGTRWELRCGHIAHDRKLALAGEHQCREYMREIGSDDDLDLEAVDRIASRASESASKAFSYPTRRGGAS